MRKYKYTVQGKCNFPVDMLRFDRCYPSCGGRDIHRSIEKEFILQDPNAINKERDLYTVEVIGEVYPTARWSSFGWSIKNGYVEKFDLTDQ